MLRVSNLTKYFIDQPVLLGASFVLNPGERMGLVGANGSGKTTLLRIIAGLERPDEGSVWLEPHARLGYLRQGALGDEDRTVSEMLMPGGAVLAVHLALQEATARLAADPHDPAVLELYTAMAAAFDEQGGYEALDRLEEILRALDLGSIDPARPIASLSGGQKTRLGLAALLMDRPDLLLLDEPTNHFDIPARERFEAALTQFSGTIIAVLHDRYAIDRLATRVLELREGMLRDVAVAPSHA